MARKTTIIIREQIRAKRDELQQELLAQGKDYDNVRFGLISGSISTPELDELYRQLDVEQAQERQEIDESLVRYNAGQATNQDFYRLSRNGYGYVEDTGNGLVFVFTGKVDGDPYADWKEENMYVALINKEV